MKREEQIISEAKKYYSDSINCHNAFLHGVEWADEHPDLSQLWHDADDMPNNHSYIMFFVDRYTIKTDYIPACLNHCQLNESNWSEFVKKVNMTKWVYVSDLLPKGGEE